MFRALFCLTVLGTLLVDIYVLVASRERATPLENADVATATMAISSGAFSSPSLVGSQRQTPVAAASSRLVINEGPPNHYSQAEGERRQMPSHKATGRRLFSRSNNRDELKQSSQQLMQKTSNRDAGAGVTRNGQANGERSGRSRRWRFADSKLTQPKKTTRDEPLEADMDNHLDSGARLGAFAGAKSDKNLALAARPLVATPEATTKLDKSESGRSSGGQRRPTSSSAADSKQREKDDSKRLYDKQMKLLNIRVKSSKDHVLISVDNSLIYESGRWSSGGDGRSADGGGGGRRAASDARAAREESSNTTRKTMATSEIEESNNKLRGIHVVVLNQFDGSVMARRTFDTYMPGQDEELCLFLRQLQRGRVVVFAVEDEASFKMPASSEARKLLRSRDWSSKSIGDLHWRDMWAFVAKFGDERGPNLGELMTKSHNFNEWAPDCELQIWVQLEQAINNTGDRLGCSYENSEDEASRNRRRAFCQRVEGYGRVCDCKYPAPISFSPEGIENSRLDSVPIVVIASNRPYYLYRTLRSLLQANGVNSSMVTIFVDGFYDEPVEVAKLFNLRAIQQRPLGRRSARISHHYKTALALTFEQLHPDASYALIFEEDLDVARDTLVYFNQTISLLERDPSLYCASAWNDQGYEHSVSKSANNARLLRIETMPGLGWLLSKELFLEELEPNWPSFEHQHDWDMWIRTSSIRRGRECLIPEISRTYHFGSTGTNINSFFQQQYFSKHAFNLMSNVSGGQFAEQLAYLEEAKYEQLIDDLLAGAEVIERHSAHNQTNTISDEDYLCSLAKNSPGSIIDSYKIGAFNGPANNNNEKTSVIYIKMIEHEDYSNWLKLAHCWHLWDLDARGQHKAMWRLHLNGRQILIVGSPASPYSKRHKPTHMEPFDLTS